MKSEKIIGIVSLMIMALIAATILGVFVAKTYPIHPQIISIDLPLRIRDKEARADNFITYETTFTQYKALQATIITYLVPVEASNDHLELTRTRTLVPEAQNLHVKNNVFIPPGTKPGEYTIHVHLEYEWNRFRTVEVHLGSDSFFVLDQDGIIQTPTETGASRENTVLKGETPPETPRSSTPATITVEGESTLKVVQTTPSPTAAPESTHKPEESIQPTPEPTPTPIPSPTPTPIICILNVCL